MNWNRPINTPKDTYPTKRSMNLFIKVDRTTKPASIALYVLFALVVLLALAKILVFDRWMAVNELQQQYDALERTVEQQTEQLANYSEIEREYILYSSTEEEKTMVDRMEILNLIDSAVRPVADISSISIKGTQVLVQFGGISLSETAQVVTELEKSPLVAKTTVDTASSLEENKDVVDANILIELNVQEEPQA